MYNQFGAVSVFLFVGFAFAAASIVFGKLVRLSRPGTAKQEVYECGEPTIGSAWIRYNSRFYNVALVYLLFDVEVVVLIPVLLVFRDRIQAGEILTPLAGVLVFLGLLTLGLAYEWFYGNLDWIRRSNANSNSTEMSHHE